ncbi:MAG: M48 family metallopeptidase [Ruminococcus sp.]|nr:M48 family metallopeptidase [Ruminococcus sp.]
MDGLEAIIAGAEVIRTKRRTIALQIAADGHLIVRSPLRLSNKDIAAFIEKNRSWIEKHAAKVARTNSELAKLEPYTPADIEAMAQRALRVIPERVRHYAELIGVTYGRITVRNQRTKWGSCTAKGNLNFNCLLMEAPPEVLDSVVVHELCHRLHMNHSREFYAAVYRVFPDYDRWDRWLKDNGPLLIRRMQAGQAGSK